MTIIIRGRAKPAAQGHALLSGAIRGLSLAGAMFHKFPKFQKIKLSDSKIPRTQNGDTDPECRIRAVARSLIGRFLISNKNQVEFLYSWPIYGLSLAFSVSNNSNNSKKWGYLLWPFTSFKKIWPYTRKYRAFVVVLVAFSGAVTGITPKNETCLHHSICECGPQPVPFWNIMWKLYFSTI